MARVHAETGIDLATNMCVTAPGEIPEAVALGSIQVLLTDHHFWGGLRASQELARTASTLGWAVSMHSNTHLGISLAAMVHAAASIRGPLRACDTHRPWQTEDVVTRPHRFDGGAVVVSDAPGLGVDLDRSELERLHRRWADSDVRRRDDVGAMRGRVPDFAPRTFPRW
jgi:glucarate dehydratase